VSIGEEEKKKGWTGEKVDQCEFWKLEIKTSTFGGELRTIYKYKCVRGGLQYLEDNGGRKRGQERGGKF
jgi:hypothetical protein